MSRIAHRTVETPGVRMPAEWWRHLEEDFAKLREGFDLGALDQLQVQATAASDVALRTVGACLVGALAFPVGYNPLRLRASLADTDFYAPYAERADPTAFFARPPRGVEVKATKAERPLFSPDDGECRDLVFESPFEPVNPRLRAGWKKEKKNRFAHARFWSHHEGPRPTIIAIHGFSADLYHLNEWFFSLPFFYAIGCDVMLFTLPFHGKRQSNVSPFSGYGFFAGGPSRINEAFAQAVHDVRIFVDWLEDRHLMKHVGVTGVSLGGYTTSLLAAVEPRFEFAIPNVPVVSLADLVLEWEPLGVAVKAALGLMRRDLVDIRKLLAVSTPLTYAPVLPRERLMIIGGIGDRLAPPKHSRLLWEHWDHCRIHWFPGSHLVHLDRGSYLRQITRFLGELGFLPQ